MSSAEGRCLGMGTSWGCWGDENGWNLRQNLYTANLLNQSNQRTVPGVVDIIAIALGTKPVQFLLAS